MKFEPTVSVVIVSRKRHSALRRVLESLRFQTYPNFEVIVVSDVKDAGFFNSVTHGSSIGHFYYDEPNISAARNVGIRQSAGEIIAFCDDDAVPYPAWLERLVQPFADRNIASSGGFVRARNGIEYQWKSLLCDCLGDDSQFEIHEKERFTVVKPSEGKFAKLQGTNCAFRRESLVSIGGFDEGFRFFLDETDVCLRLAKAGLNSAFVPDAQVHHGFAASEQRSENRVPTTLFDIGKSKTLFLSKHCEGMDTHAAVERFVEKQKVRLKNLMTAGRIEPRDVARLIESLRCGLSEDVSKMPPPTKLDEGTDFNRFPASQTGDCLALGGSMFSREKLRKRAIHFAAKGVPVVVYEYSLTSLFHTRAFMEEGFWVQKGGLFGKSDREDPIVQFGTMRRRTELEVEKTHRQFRVSEIQIVKMFRNFVSEKTKRSGQC